MPASAKDLDNAIMQMKWIAEKSFIRKLREMPEDEKKNRFMEFWKNSDPSPDTPENELMEEYYSRVAFANENFGQFRDGWDSDRGMVYIILGPPDSVERHPFEYGTKPYEVWYYQQFNRSLIFIDETGFGEYRLRSNFWDIVNQIR